MRKREYQDNGLIKLLALPVDDGGCGWYRVRQVINALQKHGLMDCILLENDTPESDRLYALEHADILLTRNGHQQVVEAVKRVDPDKPIIFDHDDWSFATSPYNEGYRGFGTKEHMENGVYLWKQGENGFDKYRNARGLINLQYILENANMATSTTPILAKRFEEYNKNSKVVPNCLDFGLYPDVEVKANKKGLRIGWSGGASHANDLRSMANALKESMTKNDTFYCIGDDKRFLFEGVNYVSPQWVQFQAHPMRIKMLDLDIAVIPLVEDDFNIHKSEVKFSEFAALKVPVLAKNIPPYSPVIQEGITGLLYNDDKEFKDKLGRLMKDVELRKRLVKNAYEWVRENRDIAKMIESIAIIYKGVLK